MKKEIVIADEKLQEEFIGIFSIGLLDCLLKNVIDAERAEKWLFSPVIAYSLKNDKFSQCLIDAMQCASEIDAMEGADYYEDELKNIKKKFIDAVKNVVKNSLDEDFIAGLI